MEKKLTRYDILLALSFVFSLIVGVGAFFYGLQTGKEQTDMKYRAFMEKLRDEQTQDTTAYHQQQLVSFYHTVMIPFRDFQKMWFEHLESMESNNGNSDRAALFKQLGKLANEKYAEIEPSTIPEVSPLLVEAHRNYLKSLKLFAESAARLPDYPGRIEQNAFVAEAYGFALEAQRDYYEAILEWNKKSAPNLAGLELLRNPTVSFEEWRKWNLNAKNAYIANMLLKEGVLYDYYPQDIASRIDDLDETGKAGKLKLADVSQAARTLVSTGGVRTGDYLSLKNKLYKDEPLPQLPFFSE